MRIARVGFEPGWKGGIKLAVKKQRGGGGERLALPFRRISLSVEGKEEREMER